MLTKADLDKATPAQLDAFIRKAAKAYYEGTPIVPDDIFDYAVELLKVKDPSSTLPYSVGFGYVVDGATQPHRVATSSLPKIHVLGEVSKGSYATPKFDGMSFVAYYKNGEVESILSRGGNDAEGEPIAHNLAYFFKQNGLDKMPPEVFAISGEVVVKVSVFLKKMDQEVGGPYANPRSAATGIARSKFLHEFYQDLEAAPFRIHFTDGTHVSIKDSASKDLFFKYCKIEIPCIQLDGQTVQSLHDWVRQFDYYTDGVVLEDREALKFPTEYKKTTVKRIAWNTPKSGNLIPVAHFETIQLYGTKVSKCTLTAGSWVLEHKLGTGAVITVTKANEIIPEFGEALEPLERGEIPTKCPACGGPVRWGINDWDKLHLTCKNKCMVEKYRIFTFVFCHAELKGYRNSTLVKILDENQIKTFDDFLEKAGSFVSVNLTGHEKKFLEHINTQFKGTLALEKFLDSLNIQGIGPEWSARLAQHIIPYLHGGGSFPFNVSSNVQQVIDENRDLILKTYNLFKWAADDGNGKKKTPVTITGSLTLPKAEFCQKYDLVQTPIGKAELLITADKSSTSNKMTEATKRGITIMTEREFLASRNIP
jgi:DNA ligase (NAD+)